MKFGARLRPRRIVVLCFALAAASSSWADDDGLATQRETFRKIMQAQSAGRHALARQFAAGMENYALYPYFRYADLRRRLAQLPEPDVAQFLSAYDDSYLAGRLRREWLQQLARSRQWELFLRHFRPLDDVTLSCLHLTARIRTGRLEGVLADTKALWLAGTSRPPECDPAFARLYASELMTDDLMWARVRLAMESGDPGLARFVAAKLVGRRRQALFELWSLAHQNPLAALRRHDLRDDAETREIVIYAIDRLARQRVNAAREAWHALARRLTFSEFEAGQAARATALAAAASNHAERINLLDTVPAANVDAAVESYRIREGVAAQAWDELSRWTAQPPSTDEDRLRWRYWRSQALAHTGRGVEARALLQELAKERDYYGFLAADELEQEYAFNFVPVAASAGETGELMAILGIVRARELSLLNMRVAAGREWLHELSRMNRRQLEVAAAVAFDWGWPDRAILALGKAASYDDLHLRFPLLYADLAREHAARRGLDPARVLAIIRAESAFVADARSPAGALGLMQVMPQTARETARRAGLRLDSLAALVQPPQNIAIGTVYLQQMLARYNGNFVMAAAAYNAGPQRVRQWQADVCVPAERWIDSIPFTETRSYVRRALFYAAIYQWRLAQPITKLDAVMTPIPPRGYADPAACTS